MVTAVAFVAAPVAGAATVANKPPVISHDPVKFGIRGQALTLKAKVEDDQQGVAQVTLYYALFRDAAPFRLPMRPTGLNFYVATIDANVLQGVEKLAYYIESQDKDGAVSETPWYNVEFRKADDVAGAEPPGPTPVQPVASSGAKDKVNYTRVGLIAGGTAALVGGILLAANSGGGGGGSSGGSNTNKANYAGTYSGDATTCLKVGSGAPSCESHAMAIVIDARGAVLSDNLLPGRQLTGSLNGNTFVLSANIDDGAGTAGTMFFNGTVVDNRVVGSVSGNAATPTGTGVYSGTFSANRKP